MIQEKIAGWRSNKKDKNHRFRWFLSLSFNYTACFLIEAAVEDYLSDTVSLYVARNGVLYAVNASLYRRLDLASLEGKVAILHSAILKNEIFAIAEGLSALDMATDKLQALGIPAEILALDNAVVNRHVLSVPKGILSLEMRVSDLHVLHVLEGILTRHSKAVDIHTLALKKRIHRVKSSIFH